MGAEHARRDAADEAETPAPATTAAPAPSPAAIVSPAQSGLAKLEALSALAALLAGDKNSLGGREDRLSLLRIAERASDQLVLPALWPALAARFSPGVVDDELTQYLEAVHALNLLRNQRLLAQAREITTALNAAGIEPVFMKGLAYLLLNLNDDPGARLIGDIDILVWPERFDVASEALRAAGYADIGPQNLEAHDRGRLLRPDRPALVELHQSAIPRDLEHLLPTRELLDRSQLLASAAPGRARAPCPEHLVIHNVVHAMLHHRGFALAEVSLRDALDLDLAFRRYGAALEKAGVMRRLAGARETAEATAFYFAACRVLLPDAPLPAPQPGSQARAALRRWVRSGGAPVPRRARTLLRLREFLQDLWWRLRHLPDQRRRFLAILLTPRRYRERLVHLADAIRYGVAPHPARRESGIGSPPKGS